MRKLESWEQMQELRPAWNELVALSSSRTVFLTWEWLTCWWAAYGGSQELVLLACCEHDGSLVGVAPFYRAKRSVGMGLTLWVFRLIGAGSGDSENLDFIVRKGYEEEAVRLFVDWLQEHRSHWDVVELTTVPAESRLASALMREATERGWHLSLREWPHLIVPLPDQWESFLDRLSQKMRESVQYQIRRLEREYDVHLWRCEAEAELPRALERLFQLHTKRWQLRGQLGNFDQPQRRSFFQEMAKQFLARGWLDFWLLDLNGSSVAAQFGFRYYDTHTYLDGGFDPAYSPYSVGNVLNALIFRELIYRGVRTFDFLGGEEPYKLRWGAAGHTYRRLRCAQPLSSAALYIGVVGSFETGKSWLREKLPRSAWNTLRTVYRFFRPAQNVPLEDQ